MTIDELLEQIRTALEGRSVESVTFERKPQPDGYTTDEKGNRWAHWQAGKRLAIQVTAIKSEASTAVS